MKDPYSVLGVSRDASDDEVKAAYRKLAKKYHPDNYADSPLADVATEKMKEVNEAYDAIMNERKGKSGSAGAGSRSSYSGYSGGYSSTEFADVRRLINLNRLDDAEQILDGVQQSARSAEWHFLKGYILYRRGWLDEASSYFQKACAMDPNNMEYRNAYDNMQKGRYGSFGGYNPSGMNTNTACNICNSLVCADCCCECMGGDLIPCC